MAGISPTSYESFLATKSQLGTLNGFAPNWMPEFLFDFQQALVDWSLRTGRSAIYADCGTGKTPMQLVWAENVVRHTNKPVLVLTPLAVSHQTLGEATKFGIDARRIATGADVQSSGIHIINYEKLHHLDWQAFSGVVCDESSILKSYDGATRVAITQFMRKIPHRLLCTATAAPNDYHELGTSSEALGYLGHTDMLTRFFKNDRSNVGQGRYHGQAANFRLKGHAETAFWRWVCSWARACRKPSDLGFDDAAFVLPELVEREHFVEARSLPTGMLFNLPAKGLNEQRDERRRTIQERCETVAGLVAHNRPALVWGHLNPECDLLEKLITGAVQVSGSDSDDEKEEKFAAFASGQARVLVTKPTIGAWGLNFQHCAHVTFFPSHSFEQYYQGVRRCWRFGQTRPVTVDIVTTEGERGVLANLTRKAKAADAMFSRLVELMRQAMSIPTGHHFPTQEQVPTWLSSSNS